MTPPHTDATPASGPTDGADLLLAASEAGGQAIRGGAARLAGFGLSTVFSVIATAIVYRHLGVVRTGDYVKITSLVALCAGLTDAGLSAIGVREFATRAARDRRSWMRDLSGLRIVLAGAGVACAVGFSALAGYGATLTAGTAIAGIAMVLVVMEDTYAISLTARLRVAWVALSDLLRVFVLAVIVVALTATHLGLIAFFAAAIPAAGCAAAVNAWVTRVDAPLLPRLRPRRWRSILRETFAFSIATAVVAIYFRVALIVVSVVASGHQTGYFSLSFRVMEVLVGVPALLVGTTFPIFSAAAVNDHERLDYAIGRVFDALWLVGVGVALGILLGAPFIVAVLGGPRFDPAVVVLRIQGVALMASFVGSVFAYALLSLHRHRRILIVSLWALGVSAAASGALAALDGARGAAIGTAGAEILFVVLLATETWRAGLHPSITWGNLPRSLAAAVLGAAMLAVPGIPDVVRLAVGLALYGGALLAVGAVPREILEQLPRLRGST